MTLSKTVYFSDYSPQTPTRSGLTITFPTAEAELYSKVSYLNSIKLRQLIGYQSFNELESAAQAAGRSVAAFAREAITASVGTSIPPLGPSSIQATFKGGRGSPLHDWYPYLEGYSPDFVRAIIDRYAPDAHTIFDPFCGSGTTALVAASMGRIGYFAEVNPVCQLVINAKSRALSMNDRERNKLIKVLADVADELELKLKHAEPSRDLANSFSTVLGKRPIFDSSTLKSVLKFRTLLDQAEVEQPDAAPFFAIAVLRSLVPNSLMIRRGDLRFRTNDELTDFLPKILDAVRSSLLLLASDLNDLQKVSGEVRFVCSNARNVRTSLSELIDAVVTSPPYLNGTNYFRNTKIELCFLGHLSKRDDLRRFRDEAITAGINDVTVCKTRGGEGGWRPPLLQRTIDRLACSAYDVRIPAMVQSYFQEMTVVADAMSRVIRPGGIAAIDIGDSCYNGIHVATDTILRDIMVSKGFVSRDHVVLRQRQSRDGGGLTQTLQVFERGGHSRMQSRPREKSTWSDKAWRTFKKDLPHQTGDMAKRNWGHSWHSLCSYQGKLKPSIASTLVAALLPENRRGRLLDPFAGVGTLPFEARLRGHESFAFDISPAATVISHAKLGEPNVAEAASIMSRLASWIETSGRRRLDRAGIDSIRFNGPLTSYFNPETFKEIVAARSFFRQHPPASSTEALVMACLLHILHGNRPYALSRRSHPITPFAPTGPDEYRNLLTRLNAKLQRSLEQAPRTDAPVGQVFSQDATAPWPNQIIDLDAIVTSPPFFDSTRFHAANWMRLWFAGWDASDFLSKPSEFVDERQKRDLAVYDGVFAQARDRLRPGGLMLVHLGKSRKCDMAAELSIIGAKSLELIDSFTESVEHCESHGIKDKGTVTHHQYLLFRN